MSPALSGSSVLQCFERSNAVEIHNKIMFNFYPGLPHIYTINIAYTRLKNNLLSVYTRGMQLAKAHSCTHKQRGEGEDILGSWVKSSKVKVSIGTGVKRSEKATLMAGGGIPKKKRKPHTLLKLTRFLVNLQYFLHKCLQSLYTPGKNLRHGLHTCFLGVHLQLKVADTL